ncbi:hypothetical protein N866_09490 [Actinotalea ferrariae CF5-4]|uniref:NADH:quinone oxidoreductase/Mrp antiporter transmembrane domain-containing protein n=1 Tax=Actinotalea ferrariae CF5-4 TaxID=948458 RepID=A0A021VTH0_9CELL|nr:proton-conducting transporter membrane subunit [Actinotalea ferrariae]EYR64504.1 hypothetical protein N866_09490 [Actinotalea ferrariae CF5-4]
MSPASGPATLAALVLVPAVVGVVLLVTGRRADRLAGPLAVATALATLTLAAGVAVWRPQAQAPFLPGVTGGELALAVDGLSAVLVVTVAAVAAAVVVFATADLPRTDARARFFGYLLLFTAAMLATVTATTIPALLLSWEIMGATSYALIGFQWATPGKAAAGTTAFLTTRLGDLGLYIAAGASFAGTGSLELSGLATADGGWRDVAAAGVLVAALGKSAQLPFSAWLSAAMQGPSAVSALLHSATMVAAGGYLLLRVQPLLEATGWAATTAAWAGALTALVLGLVAAAQVDLKQLLAASTGAQIGFVVLGAGVGSVAGGTAQWVAHAAVKAALFVVAGVWLTALGTKKLTGLRGAARRNRGIGAAATVAALALAGVPPLSLWVTKDWAMAGTGSTALRLVALSAAALSAVYAGRVLAVVLAPLPTDEARAAGRVPPVTTTVAWTLTLAAAGLAVLGLPAVAGRFAGVVAGGAQEAPGLGELAASGVIAVVVLAVVLVRPQLLAPLRRTPLLSWAGLPLLLTPRPWLAVARAADAVDARVIDRGVDGAAASVVRLARAVRRTDETVIDGAVDAVATATARSADVLWRIDGAVVDAAVHRLARSLRRLGGVMRRPQTGQLHQYYAQTLSGLGLLLALLLLVR